MKKSSAFLLIMFVLCALVCSGQTPPQTLVDTNGLIFRYDGFEKTGSRYDEHCKTTFDIYLVKGTVINKNNDKAAVVTAVLHFYGDGCDQIYSNDGPARGEIVNKLFSLDVPHMPGRSAPYWVNQVVHLLPNDEIHGLMYVEVKQGEKCPWPDHYFTYELIPAENIAPGSEAGDPHEKTSIEQSTENNSANYASFIIGGWILIRQVNVYNNGSTKEFSDGLSDAFTFNADGKGGIVGHEYSDDITWQISGKNIKITYHDGESETNEIVKLNETTLVLKEYADKKNEEGLNYKVFAYRRD